MKGLSGLARAVVFGAVAFTVVLLAPPTLAEEEALPIGQPPPDKLGKTTDGETFLVSEGVGRVQIVTFWATWCPPCLEELPVLDAIQRKGGADRIRVVAVNLKESREQFRRAMHVFQNFEIAFIHDRNGRLAKKYGVGPIPHMFIVGPDGTLATQHVGYGEAALDGIIDEINDLLMQIPPQVAGSTTDHNASEVLTP